MIAERMKVSDTPDGDTPTAREEYSAAQEIAKRKRLGIGHRAGPWQTPWLTR